MRNVVCPSCQAKNTLDSRFCRSCGAVIPEDAFDAAARENLVLVEDGRKLLNEGRSDEAIALGNAVLDLEPEHVGALALVGDAYEKIERYDRSVEAYEKILELKPDSVLDKVRLTHLRKLATTQELESGKPRQVRQLFFASAACLVLVLSVGGILLLSSPKAAPAGLAQNTALYEDTSGVTAFDAPAMVPTGPETVIEASPQSQVPVQPVVPAPSSGVVFTEPARGFSSPVRPPQSRQNGAGSPVPFSPPLDGVAVRPVPTNSASNTPESGSATGNTQSNTTGGSTDPAMTTSGAGGQQKQSDPGVVDIRPAGSPGVLTAPEIDRSAEALVRKAREQAARGDFAGAAATYEEALRKGASKGSTNQRLAQAYEKLGRRQEAIAAYRRAISAFDAEIARGNDSARIRSARDTCAQAIRTLQQGG
ncbi:MAG: tetratricopeptide repeat protein [Fimbriimonadaceae bacterium]|jgi:tetratricopeptide (TPR) repeat protein|nr:tetratricopeptide repeat protein [Fimbriimonadaceae bacterium]